MLIDCEVKQERDSREGKTQLLSQVHDGGSGGSEGEEGVHGNLIDAVFWCSGARTYHDRERRTASETHHTPVNAACLLHAQ